MRDGLTPAQTKLLALIFDRAAASSAMCAAAKGVAAVKQLDAEFHARLAMAAIAIVRSVPESFATVATATERSNSAVLDDLIRQVFVRAGLQDDYRAAAGRARRS